MAYYFDHEKFLVYQLARQKFGWLRRLRDVQVLPPPSSILMKLLPASRSIKLKSWQVVAEGPRKSFEIARFSALECGGCLDGRKR